MREERIVKKCLMALKADGSGYERTASLFRGEVGVEWFMHFLADNNIHTWRCAKGAQAGCLWNIWKRN